LFRWQYGELPGPDDERESSDFHGLNAMADAIDAGDRANFPTSYAVAVVLRYAADKIDELGVEPAPCPQCAEKDARLERVRELRQALHDESDGEGASVWFADRLDAALAATEAGDAERDAEQGVG